MANSDNLAIHLVTGGHTLEDMAGDDPASWKSIFTRADFQTEVLLKG